MKIYYVAGIPYSDELYHHGIKGQQWGVRRFQNEDGTLTSAGRSRKNSASGTGIPSSGQSSKGNKARSGKGKNRSRGSGASESTRQAAENFRIKLGNPNYGPASAAYDRTNGGWNYEAYPVAFTPEEALEYYDTAISISSSLNSYTSGLRLDRKVSELKRVPQKVKEFISDCGKTAIKVANKASAFVKKLLVRLFT